MTKKISITLIVFGLTSGVIHSGPTFAESAVDRDFEWHKRKAGYLLGGESQSESHSAATGVKEAPVGDSEDLRAAKVAGEPEQSVEPMLSELEAKLLPAERLSGGVIGLDMGSVSDVGQGPAEPIVKQLGQMQVDFPERALRWGVSSADLNNKDRRVGRSFFTIDGALLRIYGEDTVWTDDPVLAKIQVSTTENMAFLYSRNPVPIGAVLNGLAHHYEEDLGHSSEQVMAAFYVLNKTSFDIGRVNAGEAIKVPTMYQAATFTQQEAKDILVNIKQHGNSYIPKPLAEPYGVGSNIPTCRDFRYEEGFLKSNIKRFVGACSYTIGQWRLGDEYSEYDVRIPKPYTLDGVVGIPSLLEQIEGSYGIRGRINELDRTIDFEKSRGGVFEKMKLKDW